MRAQRYEIEQRSATEAPPVDRCSDCWIFQSLQPRVMPEKQRLKITDNREQTDDRLHCEQMTSVSGYAYWRSVYSRHLWGGEFPPQKFQLPPPKFFELDLNFCLFQCDFPSKNS
jgi:hypothetical protein